MWYLSRNDDLTESRRYRIGPLEVESVLLEHVGALPKFLNGKIRSSAIRDNDAGHREACRGPLRATAAWRHRQSRRGWTVQ